MSTRFIAIDRTTPMLLPADLREWLPENHLVHFILEAVEELPLGGFRMNLRGSGSAQYPPSLMLTLLIYCYATGRMGSRQIEAATYTDVAVRYICGERQQTFGGQLPPGGGPDGGVGRGSSRIDGAGRSG